MINACVSHELRNPLNSIIAQNIHKYHLYLNLDQLLRKYKQNGQGDFDELLKDISEILEQLN